MFGNLGQLFASQQQQQQQQRQQQPNQQQTQQQPANNAALGAANPHMQGMPGVTQNKQALNPNGTAPGFDANMPPNSASSVGAVQGDTQTPNLDMFKDLWQNAGNGQQANAPLFNVDQNKIGEAVKGLNFAGGVDPQLMTAALGGDQQAFSQVLNSVVQNAMSQVLFMQTKMMNGAHDKQQGMFKEMIPGMLKEHLATRDITSEMPALNHPAAQPVLNGLMQAIKAKNPNASDSELKQSAVNYLKLFAQSITPQQQQQQTDNTQQGTDWLHFAQLDGLDLNMGSVNDLNM